MRRKSVLVALLFVMSVGVKASGNLASAEAMFIYNFLRHIQWPAEKTGTFFVIGVYGNTQTYDQLLTYTKNRKVGTKSIVIKKINSVEDASNCQLIFVPHTNSSKISALIKHLGNNPCLIVSEKEGMNANGSTIEFVIQDDKLKFRINEDRARQQSLMVSRSLLDMAV